MRVQISIVLLLSIGCLSNAADKIIRVLLQRQETRLAGEFGQPVVNYYTQVDIGTPGKTFNIQFDTDLAYSFVPHYKLYTTFIKKILFKYNLHYSKGYRGKESGTSYKQKSETQTTFEYQKCTLTGKSYTDAINITEAFDTQSGNQRGKFIHTFLAISDASNSAFKTLPVDGFFGLAPVTSANSHTDNLLVSMSSQKLIDKNQFAIMLGDDLGLIHFGGFRQSRQTIRWEPLAPELRNKWTLVLKSVKMGDQIISSGCDQTPCRVVLGAALTDTYGPRDEVQKLYHDLGAVVEDSLPLVDCRRKQQLPSVEFFFRDIIVGISADEYVRQSSSAKLFGNETCYVSILPVDKYHPRQWTLGANFFMKKYIVFDMDNRKVGFSA